MEGPAKKHRKTRKTQKKSKKQLFNKGGTRGVTGKKKHLGKNPL